MESELMHHIQLRRGDVGRYVLLPGDPGRCEKIAAYLENPRQVAYNREYNTYTGELCGEKVSVMSTGIGGPSATIGVEELHMIGADTFIRIGTCGGMQREVIPGDIIVATGAIRAEGTTREYLPIEFPAVADHFITDKLIGAARSAGRRHHAGVVQCKDSYYGQHDPGRQPVADELKFKWNAWIRGGCLGSEMESAALFILSSVLRARAGAVLLAVWNQERRDAGLDDPHVFDTDPAIATAIEALSEIIAADRAAGQ